jgi:hypothetical protein
MRRKTKLSFINREDRKTLTTEQAHYWRELLSKIFKTGFEFELNLPESKGNCTGDSLVCPCSHPEKEARKCYASCVVYDSCAIRQKVDCPGIYCIEFVSPCQTCTEVVKECSRCDLFDDPIKRPSAVRDRLTKELCPTNDLAVVGNGIMQVTNDGSLLGDGGVEVTTVGRRVNYDSFYKQAVNIMERCEREGATLESAPVYIYIYWQGIII